MDAKTEETHRNDFIAADLNQDGFVDASEVRQQYPKLDQTAVSAFFIQTDINEDGLVDLTEYMQAAYDKHAEKTEDLESQN